MGMASMTAPFSSSFSRSGGDADGDPINAIEDAECPPLPANEFMSDRFDAELGD
jgi:hypothetical protein